MIKKRFFHQDLGIHPEKWRRLSLVEQLANIGSEISRAINWKKKDKRHFQLAFYRALELFSFTLADPKNRGFRLKEICRAKELLIDWFYGGRIYKTTDDQWRRYFDYFASVANMRRRKIRE